MRRPLVVVTAGVVALRLVACAGSRPPHAVDVAMVERPLPDAGVDAGPHALRYAGGEGPMANGHVIMWEHDRVYDWDPFGGQPFRSASLGDAGPQHTFAFAPVGGSHFVVARTDEADEIHYDLWDFERLNHRARFSSINPR